MKPWIPQMLEMRKTTVALLNTLLRKGAVLIEADGTEQELSPIYRHLPVSIITEGIAITLHDGTEKRVWTIRYFTVFERTQVGDKYVITFFDDTLPSRQLVFRQR